MKIKDDLVLQGMTQAAEDEIEYNTMGAFQTSDKNTHGYYIVKWTGNAYTLQEKYKCHAFYPPVIIPEGELVCKAKFMTPMKKTSYWYHKTNEATTVMVKLKQVVMPLIELIQENNTTNKPPLHYKGYAYTNPCLLSVHDHKVILEKLKREKILIMMNMWKKKITTMLIVMNLILMRINNSYYMFNYLWTTIGGTPPIACKTSTNVISSV